MQVAKSGTINKKPQQEKFQKFQKKSHPNNQF